jgi:hypothetical protein
VLLVQTSDDCVQAGSQLDVFQSLFLLANGVGGIRPGDVGVAIIQCRLGLALLGPLFDLAFFCVGIELSMKGWA